MGDYFRDLLLFAGESIREEMNTTKEVNHPNNDGEAPDINIDDGEAPDINITNTKAEKDILLLEISTKYFITS